jgi:hypothetical protein
MLNTDKLHHAYVIEGDVFESLAAIKEELNEKFGYKLIGNPDVFEKIYESFGVNDSREINQMLLDRPLGVYKILLLGIPSMTSSSGNALLKSLEETPIDTYIFIFTPNSKRLLPTLLSRVVTIKSDAPSSESLIEIDAADFLNLSVQKRLDEVKKILADYDKEKISKSEIIFFMSNIIEVYRKNEKRNVGSLQNAVDALDYASDQSSSLKILLEHISLTLI